jgi:hypothetical protein
LGEHNPTAFGSFLSRWRGGSILPFQTPSVVVAAVVLLTVPNDELGHFFFIFIHQRQHLLDDLSTAGLSQMTSRSSFASNKSRPLSAIFLGSGPSPSSKLPDLPEPPPSPGGSSNSSGLPSPPATNSTGSGSTGDDTTNFGSIRQRPASYSHPPSTNNTNMINGKYDHDIKTRSTTNINEDDEDEDDNDEDNTARLDRRRSLKNASENVDALQRVKSLAHRNRMVRVIFFFFIVVNSFRSFRLSFRPQPQHVFPRLIPTSLLAVSPAFLKPPWLQFELMAFTDAYISSWSIVFAL